MKNSLSQIQTQTQQLLQQQQLAAIQVLSARLTELPLEALRQRVENECNENPYLEKEHNQEGDSYSANTASDEMAYDPRKDYTNEDDIPDYALRQNSGNEDNLENIEYADVQNFHDMLIEQLAEYQLTEHQRQILEYIIGSLDDDGLLKKPLYQIADELDVYNNCSTNEAEVEQVLHTLWQFDPAGVGARSLQECLIIQVRRRSGSNNSLLMKILAEHWDDLSHNRWERIQNALQLDDMLVDTLRYEIKHLNPKPGSSMGERMDRGSEHVTPDFVIEINADGNIDMNLNEGDIPTLRISDDAMEMMDQSFVRGYVDKGKMFISALQQRRHTMIKTMQSIIRLQKNFFLEGDETALKPMKLEDIANITHQDLSTISRVCNSKYAETPYGIYPLKWFFSSAAKVQSDNQNVSNRKLMATLREVIEAEDCRNPFSDDALCRIMQQKGYDIARRTIAKYREQMGIPTSRLRKK